MSALQILDTYISFFEKRGHKRIPNSPLVPVNDPTTLFTSSGMQPLVPYLLGEPHPAGTRLVDVQNSFRAVDIEEVGDNRHTTFFRMLGNWSLGDYFKNEEIPWLWELLTKELGLSPDKLYITVFEGDSNVEKDNVAYDIWKTLVAEEKIFFGGVDKNWWSRSGVPDNMPAGEIGGPDTEVYYRFDDLDHGKDCEGDDPTKCECGKFLEIANSVFIQYVKQEDGTFKELPKANVDFGGGLERLLAAVEDKSDIFKTSLFAPIISSIEKETGKKYEDNQKEMRIIADHFGAAAYLISAGVKPSKTDQGYVLRRLLRRGIDNLRLLEGKEIKPIVEIIVENRKDTDPELEEDFEEILNTILEEEQGYRRTVAEAEKILGKTDDNGTKEISADEAFKIYSTHGLSPTQIKNLGYQFDEQEFAKLMEEHSKLSRAGAAQKFAGGLADHSEQTIMGHTATHLMHQALRDMFGTGLHQSGSNITSERVRFDFNFDRALTPEEIKQLEEVVTEKIKDNLPVHFEIMPLKQAKELGAIGLFDEKYQEDVKIYFIGTDPNHYSIEFCGGPHVSFTKEVKSFKIIKQENIGKGLRRLYAKVG
jgi:alanyl-tRNA synthetase